MAFLLRAKFGHFTRIGGGHGRPAQSFWIIWLIP
jgi:hypothetical protein